MPLCLYLHPLVYSNHVCGTRPPGNLTCNYLSTGIHHAFICRQCQSMLKACQQTPSASMEANLFAELHFVTSHLPCIMPAFVQHPAPALRLPLSLMGILRKFPCLTILHNGLSHFIIICSITDKVICRVVLLFYPLCAFRSYGDYMESWNAFCRDFTFVCPTGILVYNDALPQFEEIQTTVLSVCLTCYSHFSRNHDYSQAYLLIHTSPILHGPCNLTSKVVLDQT